MKKRVIALMMAAAMSVTALGGCGVQKTDKDDGKIKFSIGDWPTEEGIDLDRANERKALFEAKYPEYEIVPDTWKFTVDTFFPKAASNQLPNLYATNFTEVEQIMKNGYSHDITDILKNKGLLDRFNPQVLDIVSDDGKINSFPYFAYTLGIVYNTDLFEKAGLMNEDGTPKAPKTWDELRDAAVQIKEKTGVPGFIFPTAGNCGGWMFTNIAWSYGVDFMEYTDDGKWKATFDTEECAEALQYIKDLKWKYDVLPATSNIDYDEMYSLWGTERGAMLMSASSVAYVAKTNEMDNEKVGIFPMPAGPERHVALLGGKVYNISPDTTEEQLEGIIKYIEFIGYSPDANEEQLTNYENNISDSNAKGYMTGDYSMSVWKDNEASVQKEREIIDKYVNVNPNHFKLYNDSLTEDSGIEIQSEEPVCCQDLYKLLDNCIQSVLTDKDADCRALISEAASKFQANYLDKM